MSCGDLLSIQPSELKFPFELKKQSSCPMVLTNKTDQYVAFKVKTTNPKKYCVRPNAGVVSPGSTCDVTVTMQAQKESPPDMQCKDKFLVQSVVATHGATAKDITSELFNKEAGKVVDEFKLRVIYIPANPPSPVPEGSEEGSSPRASLSENGNPNASLFDAVSRSLEEPMEKPSEAFMISKLTEEKTSAIQQNQKLRQELKRTITVSFLGVPVATFTTFVFLLALGFGVLASFAFYHHKVEALSPRFPFMAVDISCNQMIRFTFAVTYGHVIHLSLIARWSHVEDRWKETFCKHAADWEGFC